MGATLLKLGSYLMTLFGSVSSALKEFIGYFLVAYVSRQKGKSDKHLETKGEAFEDAVKSAKDKNAINNLNNDNLDNIVFLDPKDGDSNN